jgi:glutamate synthase domain-containing protein 2
MRPNLDNAILNVLNGNSINSEANLAGVNIETLRRLVIKHPGYDNAKVQGKLHAKGILPKLEALAPASEAVKEVVAGASAISTARKHNIPLASLMKMIKFAHPNINMRYRNATPQESAQRTLENRRKALAKAEKKALEILGSSAPKPPTTQNPRTPTKPQAPTPDQIERVNRLKQKMERFVEEFLETQHNTMWRQTRAAMDELRENLTAVIRETLEPEDSSRRSGS